MKCVSVAPYGMNLAVYFDVVRMIVVEFDSRIRVNEREPIRKVKNVYNRVLDD